MVKIYLVKDQDIVRYGVKNMLDSNPDFKVVGETDNAKDFLLELPTLDIDLVITDINKEGIELIKNIRKVKSGTIRFLLITMNADNSYISQSFDAGANGYLLKDFKKSELYSAVKTIMKGENYINRSVSQILADYYINKEYNVDGKTLGGHKIEMTKGEKETIQLTHEVEATLNPHQNSRPPFDPAITQKEMSTESMLRQENESLKSELSDLKKYFIELEETNNQLITATWREREMKKKLTDTFHELNTTRSISENQSRRIAESINYSRKIQMAINPTESDLLNHNENSFILYLPKDIISGDFPWLYEKGDYLYLAAVDCTGHGVPGAMMSMIGTLLLNNIIDDNVFLTPSVILRRLHEAIVKTLKQDTSDGNSNDGMDIGLCCIDKKNKNIIFSGAHRPLYFLRNGVLEVINGDKFPIGGMHYKNINKFTDNHLSFASGDIVFLFTDGLPDQVGGPEGKRLMTRNLKQFIEENCHLEMQEFKSAVHKNLLEWQSDYKQVDDILLIGIKF
jgi:DNA-binding NarL/FixJ family response regulator/serine phosphatase RsbU (regulator of sigma subunit)